MGNSIKPHLETSQKTGVCQLSKSGLNEIPNDVYKLAAVLRTLDVSNNKIKEISGSIGDFSSLKQLTIDNNRIGVLPEEFGKVQKLESLSAANNIIKCLPNSFRALSNLKKINLSGNKLTVFPATALSSMKHLEILDLSRNSITEVPDEVGDVTCIEMNLNQNQIARISERISECANLKILRVEENCLPVSNFTPKILAASSLTLIATDGNLFEPKDFQQMEGYEQYMERYTANKKKLY